MVLRWIIPAGITHGFLLFLIAIEGVTSLLAINFVVVFTPGWVLRFLRYWRDSPYSTLFMLAAITLGMMTLIWFLIWGGFPEFSDLGWI